MINRLLVKNAHSSWLVLPSVSLVKSTMRKNLKSLILVTLVLAALLFASPQTIASEKNVGQINPEAQTFYTLGEEFKVLRQAFDGIGGSDPTIILWNRADDIIILDSTLFQKDGFAGIVPSIYFSVNQQDILPSVKFSSIGIGILFYLNR
jgi:hypothetical protein